MQNFVGKVDTWKIWNERETRSDVQNYGVKTAKKRREDNSEVDLGEVGCEIVNWIELVQDHIQWWNLVLGGVEP